MDAEQRARLEAFCWDSTNELQDRQGVRALLAAYDAAMAERDELRIYKRVVEVNGITQYDQTGSAWELIQQLRDQLAAEQAARARERPALQTMLKASESEAIVSLHDLDGSCNCRMCTELIPMMRAALAGEEGADGC